MLNKHTSKSSTNSNKDLLVKDMTSVYEYDFDCLKKKNNNLSLESKSKKSDTFKSNK